MNIKPHAFLGAPTASVMAWIDAHKPYDKRVQYIESPNSTAYFYLNEAIPNLTATPTSFDSSWVDLWEVVLGVAKVDNTDKHLFGKSYSFGLAQYNGKWRPSYSSDWPTN